MTLAGLQGIILAAGKSSRFYTGKTKLVEKICGQELILYTTRLLEQFSIPTTVVVGFQEELLRQTITRQHQLPINFIKQQNLYGTGHALACTKECWQEENILVINGDMPLITPQIIEDLYKKHRETKATISFVTAYNPDTSTGAYGRVIQKQNGYIEIVEAHEFTANATEHPLINAGIYLIKTEFAKSYIASIEANTATKEFYIIDLIKIASQQGYTVSTTIASFDYVRGINTLQELWAAEQIKKGELLRYWMDHGVRFSIAHNVHIDLDVIIGPGSYIGSGVQLTNGTKIGKNCTIGEYNCIDSSIIADNVTIEPHCVIKRTTVGSESTVGPFAHIKEETVLDKKVFIGNFVEIKKSFIGSGCKIKHHTYLGNCTLEENIIIGAGVVTCNYNGVAKKETIIRKNSFIGSNSTLIAPIIIEKEAYIAAGSVITENVPSESLAIGRSRQTNKVGYVPILKEKLNQQESKNYSYCFKPNTKAFEPVGQK